MVDTQNLTKLVDIDSDIYITGSNAYILSSELTTLLIDKILTIKIIYFKICRTI